MNREKMAPWLFLGILASGLFFGCKTPPPPPLAPVPAPPPPLRPLTQEIIKRVADPMTLQYYISSWVILDHEGIPDYPESIDIRDVTNISSPPYAGIPNRIDVNPKGTAQLRYDNLYRVILIKEQTRGALLSLSEDGSTLEICFDQNNNNTLIFRLDDSTDQFYLDQESGTKIEYGGVTYTQWLRETPILLIRMGENIERTVQVYTAGGREPPSRVTSSSGASSGAGGGREPPASPPGE
jgi:hypothetical protein